MTKGWLLEAIRHGWGIGELLGVRAGVKQALYDIRQEIGVFHMYGDEKNPDGSLKRAGWGWDVPPFCGFRLTVFFQGFRRRNKDWHDHEGHRGLSFILRGGYVEAHAKSLRCIAGTYRPDGGVDRIQVRAPCVRWIRKPHRVRGAWSGVLIHVKRIEDGSPVPTA